MSALDESFEPWLREALRCPRTGTPLEEGTSPSGEPELRSTGTGERYAYPVTDGIPVLLADEARRLD